MQNPDKMAKVAGIGFTAMLLVVAVLVGLLLQQSQAPVDSSASGLPANNTVVTITYVPGLLAAQPCSYYVSEDNLNTLNTISGIGVYAPLINTGTISDLMPVECTYTLSADINVVLEIHTYDKYSAISDSATTRQTRINLQNTMSVLETDTKNEFTYYFGTSHSGKCVATIFPTKNSFEYARLVYTGFDCNTIKTVNKDIIVDTLIWKIVGAIANATYRFSGDIGL